MLDELKKKYFKETKGFKVKAEAYLESSRTPMVEVFFENS